jgi:uncharacterized protein YnzC (UPF0291/DUF896 family)
LERLKILRINELAKKAKTTGLTDEELLERENLRKEYLDDIRKNFKATLENIEFTD